MKLSVILLSWNSEKHIVPCVSALFQSLEGIEHELIVVDNGSTDKSTQLLLQYPNLLLIKNKSNLGVSKARNQAMKIASGEFVLLLDIDTVPNSAAIQSMLELIEKDVTIGVLGCKMKAEDGEVQHSARKFPAIRYKCINYLEEKGLKTNLNKAQFYLDKINGNEAFEVDYVIGACQLIRHKAMKQVGLLDEKIFYGPEDADFCLRMKQLGWKVMYLPTVSIIHHYQRISNRSFFSKMNLIHMKSLLYYYRKHRRL